MEKITYADKEALNEIPSIADKNKCKASDLNQIKNVVNANADAVGDIVIVPTETPTEDTKLEIESEDFGGLDGSGTYITNSYSESTALAYSCDYSNEHFQGKFEKGRIPVSSMSAFSIGSDNLMHKEITFTKQYTNTPMVLTNLTTSRPRSYYGFLGTYTRSNTNTGCDICASDSIISDEYAWIDYIVISMD